MEQRISVKAVDGLIARVQRLIDARSESDDSLAWSVEASYLADLPAIAALAAIAARAADKQILVVHELDARRDLVFEAWTTPELVARWWGGRRAQVIGAEIDLRVGGTWKCAVVDEHGRQSSVHGEYREIVRNELIIATAIDELTHDESVNTVTFTDLGGRTRLTLLMHLASSEARDAAIDAGLDVAMQEKMNLLERVAASLA